jgi:hypothetical protein
MQYQIVIQNPSEHRFTASVLGLPTCSAEGHTEEEALTSVQMVMERQLGQGKVITLDFPALAADRSALSENSSSDAMRHPKSPHPWRKFAGMWANDPQFDEFVAEMCNERNLED